jgi:hypothetical protein
MAVRWSGHLAYGLPDLRYKFVGVRFMVRQAHHPEPVEGSNPDAGGSHECDPYGQIKLTVRMVAVHR